MIEFKLNGKKLKVPTSWYDDIFTFNHYCKVLKLNDDYLEVISLLTDIPYETLKTAEITGLEQLIAAASFLQTKPEFDGYCSKVGKYHLPVNKEGQFNIQFESVAQFEAMRAIMKTCNSLADIVEAYPKFVAIYIQKLKDGKFEYEKAMQMVEEVRQMPAKEVITVGSFFYIKLRNLLIGTPKTSPNTPRSPKKSKQALKRSGKSSG